MSREDWTTITIPKAMHARIKALIGGRATSPQEYVRHWVSIGLLLDEEGLRNPAVARALKRASDSLRGDGLL